MASSLTLLSPLLLLLLLPIPYVLSAALPSLFFHIPAGEPPQLPPFTPSVATAAAVLAPILSNLGYHELAMAVSSLSSPVVNLSSSPWSAPLTLFAPSDDSIRSCGSGPSCSASRLLGEHLVPGAFPAIHLSKLSFGTKLETASPNSCLTVTVTSAFASGSNSTVKIFVDGVEITHPDLFNDGKIVVHGIQGIVAPLTPFSCFSGRSNPVGIDASATTTGVMLRDAIVRVQGAGYRILALTMRIKSPELVGLQNMTVFTLDDRSIFGGGHSYMTEVRFHVVPNQLLMYSDLVRLPEGTVLPTLVRGQHLLVTQSGVSGPFGSGLRINYVPIKAADVVYNSKIVVHSLYFPFPHLYLLDQTDSGADLDGGSSESGAGPGAGASGCGVMGSPGACNMAPAAAPVPAAVSPTLDLGHDGGL